MTRRSAGRLILAMALLLGSCARPDGFADRLSDERLSELESQLGGRGEGSVRDRATTIRTVANELLLRVDSKGAELTEAHATDIETLGAYFGRLETILEEIGSDDDAFGFTSQLSLGTIPTVGSTSSQALSFSAVELTKANALEQLRINVDHLRTGLHEAALGHFVAGYDAEHPGE